MQLPFTSDEFFGVFQDYNETLWPAPVLLTALALASLALIFRPKPWSGAAVCGILAFLWAWLAFAYHLAFFTRANRLAYAFAALSLAGAATFLWHGVLRWHLQFRWSFGLRGLVGGALIVFALIGYPAWAAYAGHRFPATPTFSLLCPTTLFTIGVLAFLVAPYPRSLLVVPVIWCVVGAQAAFLLGVPQDLSLVAAALAGATLLVRSGPDRKPSRTRA